MEIQGDSNPEDAAHVAAAAEAALKNIERG
jgi:hypothetical protein